MIPRSATSLLRPAGALYGLLMTLRNRLYDTGILKSWRSPLPVVSIGNITTGGTGKTPLVDWIVKFYHASGTATAIISRGYGRRTKGVQLVSDGHRLLLGSRDAGDETVMLAARNPKTIVIAAEKRSEGVNFLMREFAGRLPGVIVLDDAFQHRSINRDLDIVVINASKPEDLDAMLPVGRLREPLSGLKRADLIILGKITDDAAEEQLLRKMRTTGKPVLRSRIKPGKLVRINDLKASSNHKTETLPLRIFAFAGIGAPAGFLHSLDQAGLAVVTSKFFRDHEPYTETTIAEIVRESEQLGLTPVTTEKDWFRIADEPQLAGMLARSGCCYFTIDPEFPDGAEYLEKRLLAVLKKGS